ncbi:MAG: dicarboxylate/amino acid:cation symporter [Pygmaiobacter massiliensis]|nr:dicarboxylate/amino acid:cation symporter [Pygmaiobacter massiliensis]
MKKIGLLPRLVLAIVAGILLGRILPETGIAVLATFNGLFGNFLNFVIPLIIVGFVVPGIGDLGRGAGKTLAITAGIAYASTVVAGSLAYFVNSALFPVILAGSESLFDFSAQNPEEALVGALFTVEMPAIMGVMSALILSFILGLGIAAVQSTTLKAVFDEFQKIVAALIEYVIIPLLPFHVLGIFANMTYAGEVAKIITVFAKVFVVIILLHCVMLLAQYTTAGAAAGKNPLALLRRMLPAYATAVGTQSSAATIPVTLECTRKNGVSGEVADFVIPLCATIHLAGSTITLTSCSLAILYISGQTPSFLGILPFILMLGVTMVAAPGVPGGAVMAALGLIESMLGFNEAMCALMIALYLAQDSFGTACNVTGDGAIAVLVDKIVARSKKGQLS